jgi:hypothetical protein
VRTPHVDPGAQPAGPAPRSMAAVWVRAVLPRPWLWATGARTVLRMAEPRWWRRWPPWPVPPAAYWAFRMETAFGDQEPAAVTVEDVVAYLTWCRRAGGRER